MDPTPQQDRFITIQLTPRTVAYLGTLQYLHECYRNDAKAAHDRDKDERLRAIQESRAPDAMYGAPAKVPDTLTIEQIATRALEQGAAAMLESATRVATQRQLHRGWCPQSDPIEILGG